MKIKHPLLLRIFLSLIVLSIMSVLLVLGSRSVLKSLYPLRYTEFVETYAEENNLSDSFVYAVIKCESSFKIDAVSYVGARGLMQIMPDTFNWISAKLGEKANYSQATDPETSIKYGCYYYGYLSGRYGRVQEILAAYHAGRGNVDKWLKDRRYSSDGETLHTIPFPTTNKYVKKVMLTENIYQKLYFRKEQ